MLRKLDSSVLLGTTGEGLPCVMEHGEFSVDDVCLLPDLRTLSVVKGIEWPERVKKYVEGHCTGECGTYFGVAVE
jgi:hypothetical protein